MKACFRRIERFFILLHAEHNNNWPNLSYRKYVRFDLELLDGNKCLLDFQFTNRIPLNRGMFLDFHIP